MEKGYESLKAAVMKDCAGGGNCFSPEGCSNKGKCCHNYCDKLVWVVSRANHYAEKTGIAWESILAAWEKNRDYWYMNYYQDCNQPEIKGDKVRVFDTVDDMLKAIGEKAFRCPACEGVSSNPYRCNSGVKIDGKTCDWNIGGLFSGLGKDIFVYVKDQVSGERIFMPLAWESKPFPNEAQA